MSDIPEDDEALTQDIIDICIASGWKVKETPDGKFMVYERENDPKSIEKE